ncbi:hypothetical protein [Streptomyces sp. NPDC008139]|uniref:hypothetical protein n=1 Tax=Streptomyces sp. NPDC008139 TaxID=3364814 RepID=UPI0036EB0468
MAVFVGTAEVVGVADGVPADADGLALSSDESDDEQPARAVPVSVTVSRAVVLAVTRRIRPWSSPSR